MRLIAENGTLMTPEELRLSLLGEFKLTEEDIEQRIDVAMDEYLISDVYLDAVQARLDPVIAKFSMFSYDVAIMGEEANTIDQVRFKFDTLRSMNIELEIAIMNKSTPPEKGRNEHYSKLLNFYHEYIYALSRGLRETELKLIEQLPKLLNDELGNFIGLQDIPRIFMEGVGKGVGGILTVGTNVLATTLKGVATGLAEGLGFDAELKKKIIKYLIIGGISVIGVLIGYTFMKSYIAEKGKKRA
ncbi:hypothetical protein LCGC14_1264720 [marine sediment metagenome]|uniref:Uncharacterized protein n=1 Tax=marine sediment metagenome TaxID=412755 RepID=A0A0F9L223_9ZZZZ